MPRAVSIAFQGGGARFVSLIAAAHALWDLQRADQIDIKAISGSSAGSLAAFLLAKNVAFDSVQLLIRSRARAMASKFPAPSKPAMFAKGLDFYIRGRPFYRRDDFQSVLSDILTGLDVDPMAKIETLRLRSKLYIMVSDIYDSKSIPAPPSQRLGDALWTSCSIPIVFSSHRDSGHGLEVDGGVFNNLPIDILLSEDKGDGPVFAIGFKPDPPKVADSAASYLLSLISSVMSHREAHSRSLVGESCFLPIETKLTTFDFDKIGTLGLDEYARIKDQTRDFFLKWLGGGTIDGQPPSQASMLNLKLRETGNNIVDFVQDNWRRAAGRTDYIRLHVTANCLKRPDEPDQILVEQLSSIPPGRIVPGVSLPLMAGAGEHVTTECELRFDGPDGPKIPFRQFIFEDRVPQGRDVFLKNTVILLIDADLATLAGRKLYTLKKEARYGFMAPLRESGEDFLATRAAFWDADEVSIQLTMPKEFHVACKWEGLGATGDPIVREAPTSSYPNGWSSFLAVATNVPHKSGIKLKLRKDKA